MDSPKLKPILVSIFLIAVLAGLAYYINKPQPGNNIAIGYEERSSEKSNETEIAEIKNRQTNHSTDLRIGFASRQKLVQHYKKHGAEFGSITLEEYLQLAQTLRDKPAGGDILEYIRPDRVGSRYEKSSNAFIAFNSDKTIRTFFKPNDGAAYFHRQKNKEH